MPKLREGSRVAIGLGEIEVYHPSCRTRVLITDVTVTKRSLTFEGICHACDRYVRLTTRFEALARELRPPTEEGLDHAVRE